LRRALALLVPRRRRERVDLLPPWRLLRTEPTPRGLARLEAESGRPAERVVVGSLVGDALCVRLCRLLHDAWSAAG
jgi:hypothetical protein